MRATAMATASRDRWPMHVVEVRSRSVDASVALRVPHRAHRRILYLSSALYAQPGCSRSEMPSLCPTQTLSPLLSAICRHDHLCTCATQRPCRRDVYARRRCVPTHACLRISRLPAGPLAHSHTYHPLALSATHSVYPSASWPAHRQCSMCGNPPTQRLDFCQSASPCGSTG
jgi:hypothetical protein